MGKDDFDDFTALVDQVYALQSQRVLSAEAKALFFAALAEHPYELVRRAAFAHLKDPAKGGFPLLPAHIEAHIAAAKGGDGRPGAEEAWSIAVRAMDETETVMMTGEIAEAWGGVKAIFAAGDEVGARMAFKEIYSRLVSQARVDRKTVAWWPSLGSDLERRQLAMKKAVRDGLIGSQSPAAIEVIPAPGQSGGLLAAPAVTAVAEAAIDGVRKLLSRGPRDADDARHADLLAARRQTTDRKAQLRAQAESLGLSDDGYANLPRATPTTGRSA